MAVIDLVKLPNNTVYDVEDRFTKLGICNDWVTGHAYVVNNLVWQWVTATGAHNGSTERYLYRCIQAHTSAVANKPGASGASTYWVKTTIEEELKRRDDEIASIISSGVNFRGITLTALVDGQQWTAGTQLSITVNGTTEDHKITPINGDIVVYRQGPGKEFLFLDPNGDGNGIWYLIDATGNLGAFAYAETANVNIGVKKVEITNSTMYKPKAASQVTVGNADTGTAVTVMTGLGGTTSFNTNAIKSATLTSYDTSDTGRVAVVGSVGTFDITTGGSQFNTDAIKSATLTSATTTATGRIKVVSEAIGSASISTATTGGAVVVTNAIKNAEVSGTSTFVTSAIGSVSLSTSGSSSGAVGGIFPTNVSSIITGVHFEYWDFPTVLTGATIGSNASNQGVYSVKYLYDATKQTANVVSSATLTGTTTFVTNAELTGTTTFVSSATLTGTKTFVTSAAAEGITASYTSASNMLVFATAAAAETGTVGISAPTASVGISASTGTVGISAPSKTVVTGYTFSSAYMGVVINTADVTAPVLAYDTTAPYYLSLSTSAAGTASFGIKTTAADTTHLVVSTGAPTYTYLYNSTAAASKSTALTSVTPVQPTITPIYLSVVTAAADQSSVTKQTASVIPAKAGTTKKDLLTYDSDTIKVPTNMADALYVLNDNTSVFTVNIATSVTPDTLPYPDADI